MVQIHIWLPCLHPRARPTGLPMKNHACMVAEFWRLKHGVTLLHCDTHFRGAAATDRLLFRHGKIAQNSGDDRNGQ
jgi:hypothetical protein